MVKDNTKNFKYMIYAIQLVTNYHNYFEAGTAENNKSSHKNNQQSKVMKETD